MSFHCLPLKERFALSREKKKQLMNIIDYYRAILPFFLIISRQTYFKISHSSQGRICKEFAFQLTSLHIVWHHFWYWIQWLHFLECLCNSCNCWLICLVYWTFDEKMFHFLITIPTSCEIFNCDIYIMLLLILILTLRNTNN